MKRLSLLLIITLTLSTTEAFSSDHSTPKSAFISFVQSIQAGNAEKAFDSDYSQQKRISGKFKHEIAAMKTKYGEYFKGNPSICPKTYGVVPCDGANRRNRSIVSDIQLFIPKTSKYEISEIIFMNSDIVYGGKSARMLVQVNYSTQNRPVYVTDLRAIQVYKGGITPVPPAFHGYGILTAGNVLLSVKECGSNYKFPFKLNRKKIKTAILEIRSEKLENSWFIRDVNLIKNQLSFY